MMDCPHCGKAFHDTSTSADLVYVPSKAAPCVQWIASTTVCPACKNPTITLVQLRWEQGAHKGMFLNAFRAYPPNTFRKPTPAEVPPDIKDDYEEACKVLPLSPKASAALSRRCLQAILQEHGYTQRDLVQQVDALLNETDPTKAIPTALRQTVDVIRNFGDFLAHRITDQTTLSLYASQLQGRRDRKDACSVPGCHSDRNYR